jgi:hypothetical protein
LFCPWHARQPLRTKRQTVGLPLAGHVLSLLKTPLPSKINTLRCHQAWIAGKFPFIGNCPIKTSIYRRFPMATFDYRRVDCKRVCTQNDPKHLPICLSVRWDNFWKNVAFECKTKRWLEKIPSAMLNKSSAKDLPLTARFVCRVLNDSQPPCITIDDRWHGSPVSALP